jgi:hypothetical protein
LLIGKKYETETAQHKTRSLLKTLLLAQHITTPPVTYIKKLAPWEMESQYTGFLSGLYLTRHKLHLYYLYQIIHHLVKEKVCMVGNFLPKLCLETAFNQLKGAFLTAHFCIDIHFRPDSQ